MVLNLGQDPGLQLLSAWVPVPALHECKLRPSPGCLEGGAAWGSKDTRKEPWTDLRRRPPEPRPRGQLEERPAALHALHRGSGTRRLASASAPGGEYGGRTALELGALGPRRPLIGCAGHVMPPLGILGESPGCPEAPDWCGSGHVTAPHAGAAG